MVAAAPSQTRGQTSPSGKASPQRTSSPRALFQRTSCRQALSRQRLVRFKFPTETERQAAERFRQNQPSKKLQTMASPPTPSPPSGQETLTLLASDRTTVPYWNLLADRDWICCGCSAVNSRFEWRCPECPHVRQMCCESEDFRRQVLGGEFRELPKVKMIRRGPVGSFIFDWHNFV